MGRKVRTTLTIDGEVIEKAKKLGINLSQYCENKLREAIQLLEGSSGSKKPKTLPNGGTPTTNNPNESVLILARLRAQHNK